MPPFSLRRARFLAFALVFTPVFSLYAALIGPSVTRGGDCGELVAASANLGIAHPSGYAVWCLLGRLFAFLPLGEIGFRYNLFSATCGALGASFIALGVHHLLAPDQSANSKRALWASLGAGWLLGGFYNFGSQALIAEVYSLAALQGALLLLFSIRWRQNNDWRDAFALAFLAGISPLVHLSGVFFLPFLAILAIWKRRFPFQKIALTTAFFALGLAPIAYFPLRSAPFPLPQSSDLKDSFYGPLDWGHPADFGRLKNHLTGAQYNNLLLETVQTVENGRIVTKKQLAQPISQLPSRYAGFFGFLALQYLWATLFLPVGAWVLFRRQTPFASRALALVLGAIWLLNLLIFTNYDVPDQFNFFFPAYLVMAIWMGVGIWRVWDVLGRKFSVLPPLLLISTVGLQWSIFAPPASQKGVTRVRDAALEQATAAQNAAKLAKKPASVFFDSNDALWPFWYAKYALKAAPDAETPWGRRVQHVYEVGKMADYVAQLQKRGPVLLAHWDEETDRRFPFLLASPSGNVALASNRKLPLPARTIPKPKNIENNLFRAQIRRSNLWKPTDSVENPFQNWPQLHAGTLAAFEIDFRFFDAPQTPQKTDYPWKNLEILMVKSGFYEKNGPPQNSNQIPRWSKDKPTVWRQIRRIIVAPDAQNGDFLRATVPFFVAIEFSIGPYEIWTRLAPNERWKRGDAIYLTQK